jgi:hypothetical protein
MKTPKLYILVINILVCLCFILHGDAVLDIGCLSGWTGSLSGIRNPAVIGISNNANISADFASAAVFPADYVLYFKFDYETGGVTPDETGTNNGILVGDAAIINDAGKGSFLTLDGVEDYVEVGDSPLLDIQHQITLSVWLKLNQLPVSITKIIVKPTEEGLDPWELYALDVKRNTGEIRFVLSDGTSYYENGWHSVVSTLPLNQWNHIVGTYDGTTMKLYANGLLVNSKSVSLKMGANNQDLYIGKWLSGSSINGQIDDVMIFNRALNSLEIQEIYEGQKPRIDIKDKYMIGLFFPPAAANYLRDGIYTNYDHSIFFQDYADLIDTLSELGFNTIVIYTHFMFYRYEFDARLNNARYPAWGDFNSTEIKEMVRIAKQKGIKTIPALQVLSHQNGGVLSQVYPEYMLAEPQWKQGMFYRSIHCVEVNGVVYNCSNAHTSTPSSKPGYGAYWQNYWITYNRRTRDPFNQQAEQMVFAMIDELIEVFTVDGEKPEAIHIVTDELSNWLDCPEECNGMSSAEVFAMVITNVYNHIKENNPDIDIIMSADMLDENWNGGKEETPVAGAIDLLPKDIILNDWRYEATSYYGFDYANRIFPSVGKYMDKGYNVIVSPWRDVEAAEELIWTGKKQDLRTGRFMGVIYNSLLGYINYTVPSLNYALNDYPGWEDLIPNSYKYLTNPPVNIMVQEVADVIEQTIDIINSEDYQYSDE